MNIGELIAGRDILREKWRKARAERLELKLKLMADNYTITEIRHNSDYKRLKKEQKHMSKRIKHVENEICRMKKNGA